MYILCFETFQLSPEGETFSCRRLVESSSRQLFRYSATRLNLIFENLNQRKVKRDSKKSGDLLLNLEESSVFKENCEPLDEIIKRLDAFSSEEIAESQMKIISILESISKSKRFSVSIGMVLFRRYVRLR